MKFRTFVMKNGLEVFILQDKSADKAYTSLNVEVGILDEPIEQYGFYSQIARVVLHSSFNTEELVKKGKKRPQSFRSFVERNNGSIDASVAMEYTTFTLQIAENKLHEGLTGLAQSVYNPVIPNSELDNVLETVNSEIFIKFRRDKNVNSAVEDSIIDQPGEFFKVPEIIDIHKSFVFCGLGLLSQYYTADKMKLAIICSMDPGKVEFWVRQAFAVMGKSLTDHNTFTSGRRVRSVPDLSKAKSKLIRFANRESSSRLRVFFFIPDQRTIRDTQPSIYFSHLLTTLVPGSFHSILRRLKLLTDMSSYFENRRQGIDTLVVDMEITDIGIEQVAKILSYLQRYLTIITDTLPVEALFNEACNSMKAKFMSDKSSSIKEAVEISFLLRTMISRKSIIEQKFHRNFNVEQIIQIGRFLKMENSVTFISSMLFKDLPRVDGQYYAHASLSDYPTLSLEDISVDLKFPTQDPFVPQYFQQYETQTCTPIKSISHNVHVLQDTSCARTILMLRISHTVVSAKCLESRSILSAMLECFFNSQSQSHNINLKVNSEQDFFDIKLCCYPEILELALTKMFDILSHQDPLCLELFDIFKQEKINKLPTIIKCNPQNQVMTRVEELVSDQPILFQDRLDAIESLRFEDLPTALRGKFLLLCGGNVSSDLVESTSRLLESATASPEDKNVIGSTVAIHQNIIERYEVREEFSGTFANIIYYFGEISYKQWALLSIFSIFMDKYCFKFLIEMRQRFGKSIKYSVFRKRSHLWFSLDLGGFSSNEAVEPISSAFASEIIQKKLEYMTYGAFEELKTSAIAHYDVRNCDIDTHWLIYSMFDGDPQYSLNLKNSFTELTFEDITLECKKRFINEETMVRRVARFSPSHPENTTTK